ncbi:MAG TPA: S1 RNA-binding domain-containing protein [Syntrophobacteraceae bacterium]|nr:S1 RNA-binding domain-containing protein [Syntrophobacteraceae bacterium]
MMEELEKNEPQEEESFEELLKKSRVVSTPLRRGEKVKTVVLKITPEWTFLDLGGKSEGLLSTKEIQDEEGNPTVKEGDVLEAFFLSSEGNETRFTTRITGKEAAAAYLEDALAGGIPVEGVIEKEIKGGYQVKLPGNVRGFCPFSQMGLPRTRGNLDLTGQRMTFKVIEYEREGRRVLLSNRAILEEARRVQVNALKESLKEGMIVRGTVVSVKEFGAFLDIGAVQGLIPISEIGYGRVEDIHQWLKVGQEVEVMVVKLDWEKERFSFSIKAVLPDPWEDVPAKYPEGSVHRGTVTRPMEYGAFVQLEPGVEGLLPISEFRTGRKVKHARQLVTEGQSLTVKVLSVDGEARRISLGIQWESSEEGDAPVESAAAYAGSGSKSMGTLGDLLTAKGAGKERREPGKGKRKR